MNRSIVVLLAAVAVSGCASRSGTPNEAPELGAARAEHAPIPRDDALFIALGGHAGIDSLTERFIREIAADQTIRAHFSRTDISRFDRMLQQQLCAESGGGCTYNGDDMRRAHAGLDISRGDFNAVVEALMRAMDAEGLDVATQNRVLALHAPKRHDILDE